MTNRSGGRGPAAANASRVLGLFVERFPDVFYGAIVGERRVDPGIPVLFTGACSLTSQLAMEAHVKGFRGFVARYWNYASFGELLADATRPSIDKSIRMVVVPEVHRAKPSELKRLCSAPGVWVVASGRASPAIPALFQVEVVAPDPVSSRAAIVAECAREGVEVDGIALESEFETLGEFVAACDGFAGPSLDLEDPAETAHRLVASGAPTSYICRTVFRSAVRACGDDEGARAITKLAADCDAEMARCRRPLVLSKILEIYLRKIAEHAPP
jgi:hypothetical protein